MIGNCGLKNRPVFLYFYRDSRNLYFENKTIFTFSKIGYFVFSFDVYESAF